VNPGSSDAGVKDIASAISSPSASLATCVDVSLARRRTTTVRW
jgi:hypothetical protein